MHETLLERFTANKVSSAQSDILNLPWRRIYTTNYDNVCELAYNEKKIKYASINAVTSSTSELQKDICSIVHLNGCITDISFKEFDAKFRLTRASYLTDAFINSAWFSLLRNDLVVATAIIIVGYSTYDIDIARILYSDPTFQAKLYFIESIDLDPIYQRELSQFGQVIPIGVDEFAFELASYSPTIKPTRELIALSRFQLVEPKPSVSGDDVFNLLMFGDYQVSVALASRQSQLSYAVQPERVNELFDRIKSGEKYFLIHSDLGNGKTIFVEHVMLKAIDHKMNCYVLNSYDEYIEEDIRSLENSPETLIVVEDVFRNSKALSKIVHILSEATVVMTTRSTIYELRPHRVREFLGANFIEYDINKLTQRQISGFVELLEQNGLWGSMASTGTSEKMSFIEKNCSSEIRNLLIKLLESPEIRARIVRTFTSQPDNDCLKIICTTLLMDVGGIYPDLSIISQLTGIDVYKNMDKINNTFSLEFVDKRFGTIRVKSSILGEYVLQNVLDVSYVLQVLIDIVKKCEKARGANTIFSDLQRELIRFSFVDRVFKRAKAGTSYKELYDNIKDLPSMARNPQFWLQYEIARLEDGNFSSCQIHFRTAYSHARSRTNYDTFQIDNHYARFLLESRIKDPSFRDDFKSFLDAHALLIKQARKEKDAYYPYKVARNYLTFYKARCAEYEKDQIKSVLNCAKEMLDLAVRVPKTAQKYFVIDECVKDLRDLCNSIEYRL